MSTKTYYTIFTVFILISSSLGVKAQDSLTFSPNKVYWWAGPHFGGGTYSINGGFDLGFLLRNKFVIALTTDASANIQTHFEARNVWTNSLLLGYKLTRQPKSNLSILTGASALQFTDRGEPTGSPTFTYGPEKIINTIGIPVMLRYTLVPAPVVGMDFSAGMNFNSHRNFFQLSFGVSLGHLRDK